ncbi:transglycosylase domain-containing protein [Planococcus sp. APC 3900]|uniref:transglycosylase domain-containing protein n=1 Tax=Planococcus sp. APC 3900 TaxID=3035191 RepID=UPI0025B3DA79|nr:transglycosylase domain-containing protein [Planococcus sp. APC 3900]MDN3439613.1 transglycosylase domain-containing protein [Planococcus sp. APC 3900]
MRDKIKYWTKKAEETTDRWASTKWFKRLSITSGVIWNLALILAIVLVTGGVFAASVGAGYFASLVDEEKLRTPDEMRGEIYSFEETSELYFDNDVYLGKLQTDLEREVTTLDKVSTYAKDAVLATEDEYFLEHEGIVPKAILRGLFQDVSNSDSQTGGSTLTQQLIKNQILTNEVSYERKAKEILLAMRLEKFMTKNEIMEAYLNIIPYGRISSGAHIAGIETAAKGIFNVPASDLNLPQAAFIAGIPKAPYSYTPYFEGGKLKDEAGLQPGLDRMKTVLYRMKETEYITQQEYDEAIAYDIVSDFRQNESRSYSEFPFVTVEIEKRASRILMDVLAEKDGIDPATLTENDKLYEEYAILADRAVRSNGYRIHSTIDKDLYLAQEEAQKSYPSYGTTVGGKGTNDAGEVVDKQFPVQVGSIMIENATGRILSFVGGRDHDVENLNHATSAYRSMGSTVKPLLVYGPAIELGQIGAGSPLVDVKFEHMDGSNMWRPANFIATSEQGIMPARDALAQSQNLPTIRLFAKIQQQMPIQYMMNAGFTRVEKAENDNLSSSLGGGIEASVEEISNGYAMIGNNGQYIQTTMIDKIEDAEGNVIYEHKVEPKEVFTPPTAYVLTDMLRDVFKTDRGTAKRANDLLKFNADFAGKTGTTDSTKDVWLVGYNPNVTMGVWLGYDSEKFTLSQFENRDLPASLRVNQLWARLMNASYDVKPELVGTAEKFKQPEGVVTKSFCGISGLAPGGACQEAGLVRSDLFNAQAMVPTEKDDSLTSGSFTSISGKRYAALPSTPREFVSGGGIGVSQKYIDRIMAPFGGDASKLFPGNSKFSSVVSGAAFKADGAAPSGVKAAINGNTITWTDSPSNDVVGYRVYKGGSRVASISEAKGNSYSASGAGSYTVVAVDITGKQSAASSSVSIAAPKPKPKPEPKPEPKPTPPPEEKEPEAEEEAPAEEEVETPPAEEEEEAPPEEEPEEPVEEEPAPDEPEEPEEPAEDDAA